jgi:predicted aldo/keto reductase-like oxidoreductase
MKYKTLGDTGLLVSTVCFGTMTFHGGKDMFRLIGTVDQAGADELIKASLAGGINFFDTTDVYSEGESERILGQSLRKSRGRTSSSRPRFTVASVPATTTWVPPGGTSWTPSTPASGGFRPTTSTFTRSTATTP